MTRSHRLRLWLTLALLVVLVAAAALWLRGTLPGSMDSSLPTPVASRVSPLPTPTLEVIASTPPSPWLGGGAVLLWVVLGIALALGIALIILRWYRRAA